ncbi:hypothetical protein GUJ93_ZPchr0010g11138 [Zizania palustris]|uniref:Uncharacterized protein n=1 Tax=Zizania palustris TaxID=103762 RepID=A0A8J5WEF1_ZIZPA|nr:hypothetical protein GUJ93_ZPchr0010g11138 [Zizania palustris]
MGMLPREVGARGLEREQQQRGEPEEERAGSEAGQGELLLVGVGGFLLRVVGQWLDGHGLGEPRRSRAIARPWLLPPRLRLEMLASNSFH